MTLDLRDTARTHGPLAAIALIELVAIQHVGAYHPRLWGWLALAAVIAALAFAVRTAATHIATAERMNSALATYLHEMFGRGRWTWRTPMTAARWAAVALTVWTFASLGWAHYSHHLAWDEANRTLGYTALLAVGGALCWNTRRLAAAGAWIVATISVSNLIVLVRLGWRAAPATQFIAGRLSNPIGYANGQAALELFCLVAALGAAALHDQRARAASERSPLDASARALVERGLLQERAWAHPHVLPDIGWAGVWTGTCALAAALTYLCESRGTIIAAIPAIIALIVLVPRRTVVVARIAVVGALLAWKHTALAKPFASLNAASTAATQTVASGRSAAARTAAAKHAQLVHSLDVAATNALKSAAHATLLIAVIATAAGIAIPVAVVAIGKLLDHSRVRADGHRPQVDRGQLQIAGWLLAIALVAIVGAVATSRANHSPGHWLHEQYEACVHPQSVKQTFSQTSHFADVGTNRCDFWRVEWHNFTRHPLVGIGANQFQGTYVLNRRSNEEPLQDHSLGLQLLGELGIVGFALGLAIVVAAAIATLRFTRSSPIRSPLIAATIAATIGWFAQANIDWLWNLPAVTIPAVLLTGGLLGCASQFPLRAQMPHDGARNFAAPTVVCAAIALVAAAALVPPALADHADRRGIDPERQASDPSGALASLESAARLDRTWAQPLLSAAALRRTHADAAGALTDTAAALAREPDNWSVQYDAYATYHALGKSHLATAALARARVLNPSLK